MKTIWKIATACFVGGVLCSAVALKLTPTFWWLGLLAGFAGGYLSYEFREVLITIREIWYKKLEPFKHDSAQPHPFLHFSMLLGAVVTYLLVSRRPYLFDELGGGDAISWLGLATFTATWLLSGLLLLLLTYVGAESERYRWWSRFPYGTRYYNDIRYYENWCQMIRGKHYGDGKGYREGAVSYANVFRWVMKGIPLSIWYVVSKPFKWTWLITRGVFLVIHSEKRLLCAVDGTLGGAVGYLTLASHATMFQEKAVLVFFGGLLGAMFGVLNYEVVSKRILRLVPMKS